jgi:hypothetical protein
MRQHLRHFPQISPPRHSRKLLPWLIDYWGQRPPFGSGRNRILLRPTTTYQDAGTPISHIDPTFQPSVNCIFLATPLSNAYLKSSNQSQTVNSIKIRKFRSRINCRRIDRRDSIATLPLLVQSPFIFLGNHPFYAPFKHL